MDSVTFNTLECVAHAVKLIAQSTITEDEATKIRERLNHCITVSKIALQRDQNADISQATAAAVIGLSKFMLGRKPVTEGPLERKHLEDTLKELSERYEERDSTIDCGKNNGSGAVATPAPEVEISKESNNRPMEQSIEHQRILLWFQGAPVVSISRLIPEEFVKELADAVYGVLEKWKKDATNAEEREDPEP